MTFKLFMLKHGHGLAIYFCNGFCALSEREVAGVSHLLLLQRNKNAVIYWAMTAYAKFKQTCKPGSVNPFPLGAGCSIIYLGSRSLVTSSSLPIRLFRKSEN